MQLVERIVCCWWHDFSFDVIVNEEEREVEKEGREKAPGDLWVDCRKPEAETLSKIFNPVEMRQVHILIEDYLRRLEEIEDSKWAQREWELVAQIMDKAFLYVFSSALALTVFSCSIHILNLDGYWEMVVENEI